MVQYVIHQSVICSPGLAATSGFWWQQHMLISLLTAQHTLWLLSNLCQLSSWCIYKEPNSEGGLNRVKWTRFVLYVPPPSHLVTHTHTHTTITCSAHSANCGACSGLFGERIGLFCSWKGQEWDGREMEQWRVHRSSVYFSFTGDHMSTLYLFSNNAYFERWVFCLYT